MNINPLLTIHVPIGNKILTNMILFDNCVDFYINSVFKYAIYHIPEVCMWFFRRFW